MSAGSKTTVRKANLIVSDFCEHQRLDSDRPVGLARIAVDVVTQRQATSPDGDGLDL